MRGKMFSIRNQTLTVLVLLVVAAMPALAQSHNAEVDDLKTEVAKLRAIVAQQQSVLEQITKRQDLVSTAALAKEVKAEPKAEAKSFQAGWENNRPVIRSAAGDFQLNFGGFAHFDLRGYGAGSHPPNTFLVRRARLFIDGKVAKYYEYKVEADFADTSSTVLRDGWVRIHRWDPFQVQIGHFKEPFSQEELRGDPAQDFVERSLANVLAPSRSPGIMVLGVVGKGVFEYQ